MRKFDWHYFVLIPAGLAWACGAAPTAGDEPAADGGIVSDKGATQNPDESATSTDEKVGTESQPLLTGEYYWSQGNGPTQMTSTSNSYCFLTGVAGHFVGFGEAVQVSAANGVWTLSGSSGQQGVQGWARCLNFSDLNGNRAWNDNWGYAVWTGNGNTNQTNSYNIGAWTMCGLRGIGGAFGGPNDAAYVTWGQSGSQWDFTAVAQHIDSNNTNGTEAYAGCVNLNPSRPPLPITTAFWWQDAGYLDLGPASSEFCQLSEVEGQLEGSGTGIHLIVNGNNHWVLTGGNTQGTVNYNVYGEAACIAIPVN